MTRAALTQPVDGASLIAFRRLFGLLMAAAGVRYWANGWIDSQLIAPAFHFTWPGLGWVQPLPGWGMYAVFASQIAAALALAIGWRPRLAAGVFTALFTWIELIDQANYLNHYYLVSLIGLLLTALPIGERAPRLALWLLRFQFGWVWLCAGLAKLNGDWLLRGEPLATWLPAHAHWPLIGPLLAAPEAALVMSWAGAAFDLSVAALLLWPRTRRLATAVAVGFHLAVWALFPIGVFSPLMLLGVTLFWAPGWPRGWGPRGPAAPSPQPSRRPRALIVAAGLWVAVQIALPARHLLYPGPVNWTEEGFRFAWRVMLVDKVGQVEYRVVAGHSPRPTGRWTVHPRAELTPLQARMMATQPDMIHAYAHHLARRFSAQGHPQVAVYADAFVAFNGRPARRLIDPAVDLVRVPRGLGPAGFILPGPE